MSIEELESPYITINGEQFYKFSNFDAIRPFFMTIVSPSDHWLFIASNGGLTAGRKNSSASLFPYYTDDKIIDLADITGSKTIIRVEIGGKRHIWKPFSDRNCGLKVERNLYKNRVGNKVVFEEVSIEAGLSFQYMWTFSEKYGFVKQSNLKNYSAQNFEVEILDGIQNILPSGVDSGLQESRSTLVDAYKKNELDRESGLGIYSLSAMIVDKAEPSESLSCTTVWSKGLEATNHLLSSVQLKQFRNGNDIINEHDVRAEKGAYFVHSNINLKSSQTKTWCIVSEVNQSHTDVFNLRENIIQNATLLENLVQDIDHNTTGLRKLVAKADGLQKTNDTLSTGRHFSNVLFNIMRGGIFDDQYVIYRDDFVPHVEIMNRLVYENNATFLNDLPEKIALNAFIPLIVKQDDTDLIRLSHEYLPLFFSRRHGDPSRPWNYFSIETKDDEDQKIKKYEGNWRDIFQNWEALALSFPSYTFGFISKFLNASTIDGYNPYRIYKEGIDWEVADEDDPWSYIGYWGDHQIIYLCKLLEIGESHFPNLLRQTLTEDLFVYANVPYRIKEFNNIVDNPRDTIEYDYKVANNIAVKVSKIGADGKLCLHRDDTPVRANLAEKIIVTLCTKLYNFIPSAGIWLNTQRPEWNDANNALVGNGTSMVTLYYMRRFIAFLQKSIFIDGSSTFVINRPVARLIQSLYDVYASELIHMNKGFTDSEGYEFVKTCGDIGEYYRRQAYAGFKAEKETIDSKIVTDLLSISLKYIDATIQQNKRKDKLYEAYNVINVGDARISVSSLYEMLEGQVAILSSGNVEAIEACDILNSLKESKMYRPDQYSYLLYPDRQLPTFLTKNTIPKHSIDQSELLTELAAVKETSLIEVDVTGQFHFAADIHNASDVKEKLNAIASMGYRDLVKKEQSVVLEIFESIFNHKSFTGRSGTFYGYEGLGSIYWHMVSKLLVAVQENIISAYHKGVSKDILGNLIDHYYEIRAGIGVNKSPHLYGGFPTDAYSHTPGNVGVQQPGMTGQVKEDILNRWAELGVVVHDGCVTFEPLLLRNAEFLPSESEFDYYDVNDDQRKMRVPSNGLVFTYCQVPIVYVNGESESIRLILTTGKTVEFAENALPLEWSKSLFERDGKIESIQFTCVSLLVH